MPRIKSSAIRGLAARAAMSLGLVCALLAPRAGAAESRRALLSRFFERIGQAGQSTQSEHSPTSDAVIPDAYRPWWDKSLVGQLRPSMRPVPVDLDGLILGSLEHSSRIQSLGAARMSAYSSIPDAMAAFDWRAFMDSRWVDTSDPVGSLLTTGGPDRYQDHDLSHSAGLRRDTPGGGHFEISQEVGLHSSNSTYLIPPNQGEGKLVARFSQPLLRGAGRAHNERYIVLAQIDAGTAEEEFVRQAQTHLLHVSDAYWQLYLVRAMLLQKQRLYERGEQISTQLESRKDVDASASQILQAKAALFKRQVEILRAEKSVKDVESRIRSLVNDPDLRSVSGTELVPCETPSVGYVSVSLSASLTKALMNRPEIEQAINEITVAQVELGASQNEMLPALDLLLEAYVSGLEGRNDVGMAFAEQFSQGEPSYTVGLALDVPLGNRAAKARLRKRRFELQKTMHDFATAVETIWAEVEIAVGEVQTSHREMSAAYHAMLAQEAEVASLQARWEELPGDGQVGSMVLEQLLENQEELANFEFTYSKAQVSYNLALTKLMQVEGTLLQVERGQTSREMPTMAVAVHPNAKLIHAGTAPPHRRMIGPPPSPQPLRLPTVGSPRDDSLGIRLDEGPASAPNQLTFPEIPRGTLRGCRPLKEVRDMERLPAVSVPQGTLTGCRPLPQPQAEHSDERNRGD